MAEWARLLSECRGNLVAGSNPALPATKNTSSDVFFVSGRAPLSAGEMIFASRHLRLKNPFCKERVFVLTSSTGIFSL